MADAYDDGVRRAVLEALDAGDERLAIEILLVAYGQLIYGYCRRMLGTAADAEDAMQIVFKQAMERMQRLREVECFRAWLLVVARNRCLDRIEKRERDRSQNGDDESAFGSCPVSWPPGDPLLRTAIEQCLDALDHRSRTAILLKFVERLTYNEMSDVMKSKPGALRVRVARSLPALRACLKGKGIES